MDTIILSFQDDEDEVTQWQAIVDTLDPIRRVIDTGAEPQVPDFPGCILLDSSYGSEGDRHEFVIEYDLENAPPLDPKCIENTLREFLVARHGIQVKSFGVIPLENDNVSPRCSRPR